MLSLTRNCNPNDPDASSTVFIGDNYRIWVKAIHHRGRAITLQFDSSGGPEIEVDLSTMGRFRFADVSVELVSVNRARCVVSFDAPSDVKILRGELVNGK